MELLVKNCPKSPRVPWYVFQGPVKPSVVIVEIATARKVLVVVLRDDPRYPSQPRDQSNQRRSGLLKVIEATILRERVELSRAMSPNLTMGAVVVKATLTPAPRLGWSAAHGARHANSTRCVQGRKLRRRQ